jgi:prepilin-type N-terminal cleavage/methylation domain-containing protein
MIRRHAGFTVIELLTVVAVLGLLVAMGIPAFRTFSRSADIKAAATQVAADAWFARQRAIATSDPYSIRFDPDGNSYSVFRDDGNGTPSDAANGQIDTGEEVVINRHLDERFDLSYINLDPTNAAIFMPKGSLKLGTAGGHLMISGENASRTVFIRPSGMCKVE